MADNFGLRIGIEGEAAFKKALSDINQAFKVLGSEMQLVVSQFDKNDKSAAALTARNAVLNKEIDSQKDKIETLKAALDNAASSFGENDRRTQNWQAQLNKAEAQLNGMEKELKANNTALSSHSDRYDTLGKEIEATAREYVRVRDEYGKNSTEAKALEKKLKELGAEHNAAGKAADAEDRAVADVTKSLGLYQRETDQATKETSLFGDMLKASLLSEAIKAGFKALVDLVKSVGSAVKSYMADSGQMAAESVQSQTLLTQVMRNTMGATDDEVQSLIRLAEQQERNGVVSKTAQVTAMAEMASFVYKKEAMEAMLPVMNDYIAYQYGTTASNEQARNVATALGKAIQGNIDGLSKQGFTLTQNERVWFKTASEEERVAFVTDMVSESMRGVNQSLAQTDAGKMANLKTVMDNTKIAVGQMANEFKAQILGRMLPSISSLSDAFLGVMRGENSIQSLSKAFDDVFKDIAGICGAFLPKLAAIGGNLISALVTGLANNIQIVTDIALTIVNQLLKTVLDVLPSLAEAGVKLALGLIEGIVKMLPDILEAGLSMVSKLSEGLGNAVPILKPITVAISGIIDVLKAIVPYVLAAAAAFGAFTVIQTISNAMRGLTVATAAQTIAQNIQTAATTVATAVQWLLNAAMLANPIGLLIAGVAALAAGIAVLLIWFNRESEEQKRLKEATKQLIEENDKLIESVGKTKEAYSEKTAGMETDAAAAKSLADKIAELSAVEDKSAEQKQQLAAYVSMLNEAMGESVVEYDEETDSMSRNIAEVYSLLEARQEEAKAQAARERAVEIAKEQMAAEEQLNKIERQRIELDEALAAGTIKKSFYNDEIKKLTASENDLVAQQDDLQISFENATKTVAESAEKQKAANAAIVDSSSTMTEALKEAYDIQAELADKKVRHEQEVTEAMVRAASEQGLTLEEYKAKLSKLQKEEEALYQEREKTLENYTGAATEMFKKMNAKSELSVKDMTTNMKHNQKVLEEWSDNLIALADRGIDQGLLERLRKAGPESAGTVAALVSASDTEFKELNTVFANGSQVATDALLKQLGLPDVVNSGSGMVDDIASGVDANTGLQTATERLIKSAKSTASGSVAAGNFDDIGKAVVEGVYKGISDREAWFRSQVTAFFKRIVGSVKDSLGIQSPSRVFAEIGKYMAEGVGVGFESEMDKVADAMQDAFPTDFDLSLNVDPGLNIHGGNAYGRTGGVGAGTNITQHISITSPKALSEKEAAREFKNLSRKLALDF